MPTNLVIDSLYKTKSPISFIKTDRVYIGYNSLIRNNKNGSWFYRIIIRYPNLALFRFNPHLHPPNIHVSSLKSIPLGAYYQNVYEKVYQVILTVLRSPLSISSISFIISSAFIK